MPVTTGFVGAVQGVKVAKLSVDDQAETELLSLEQAERTCHS